MTKPDTTRQRKGDILIVDDEPANLRLLAKILDQENYGVRTVINGDMALKSVALRLPDLILLDINLPDMSGYDICDQIKRNETTRTIPIIFISALEELDKKVKAFAVGGADYITKPFHAQEVLVRLETHLSLLRTRQALVESQTALQHANMELEERVAERTARLLLSQFTLDNAADGIYWLQKDASFAYVNNTACHTLGYTRFELLMMTMFDIDPMMQKPDWEHTWQGIKHVGFVTRETYLRAKDGRLHPVEVTATYMVFDDQEYICAFARDILRRKQMEEAMRDKEIKLQQMNTELEQRVEQRTQELFLAKEQAEAANRAKGAFLSSVGHELRTPLNAILGFTQIMENDQTLSEKHREQVWIIRRSGEHLLALINDILHIARLESGDTTIEELSFDLHHMIDDIADLYQIRAQDKGLHFCLDKAADLPPYVHTDEKKLRQVLMNLLSNAIKFTSEGHVLFRVLQMQKPRRRRYARTLTDTQPLKPPVRMLEVAAQTEPLPQTAVGDASHETQPLGAQTFLRFEIEDTGCGISPDKIPHLFEVFEKLSTDENWHEGTGMGLYICQHFIQLMNGEIHVMSEPGNGSLFSVIIPIDEAKAAGIPAIYTDTQDERNDDEIEDTDPAPLGSHFTLDMLATLHPDQIEGLHNAAGMANIRLLSVVITDIQQHHPVLAEELSRLVADFRFDQILAVTEQIITE